MIATKETTEEKIKRIYGGIQLDKQTESVFIGESSPFEASDEQIKNDNSRKVIEFVKRSEMLRSRINKTNDPQQALDMALECISCYLDDQSFFYQQNKKRLIRG